MYTRAFTVATYNTTVILVCEFHSWESIEILQHYNEQYQLTLAVSHSYSTAHTFPVTTYIWSYTYVRTVYTRMLYMYYPWYFSYVMQQLTYALAWTLWFDPPREMYSLAAHCNTGRGLRFNNNSSSRSRSRSNPTKFLKNPKSDLRFWSWLYPCLLYTSPSPRD